MEKYERKILLLLFTDNMTNEDYLKLEDFFKLYKKHNTQILPPILKYKD
ncbi:hypothetical protein cco6_00005 [Campylobacter coli 59-2]|nr:hypothetical protein cco6_00005 [Campylobacter coli 59-2]